MNQYIKQYRDTQIQTASPEAILILLHDGIVQYLNVAKVAITKKDIQTAHDNLMRAQNILHEFINTINPDPNPELAKHLTLLYRFLIHQCVQANMNQDTEPIDIALSYVKDLKTTWEQASLTNSKLAKEQNNVPSTLEDDDDEEERSDYSV